MKDNLVLIWLLFFTSIPLVGQQVDVNVGYVFGLNSYMDTKQDNLATKFNLGWEYQNVEGGYDVNFFPGTTEYTVKNRMNINRTTRGFHLGLGFDSYDDYSFELNFVGCTNVASGTRMNVTKNIEEKLTLITKFGGVQFLTLFNVHKRFSLHFGAGVNLFRSRISWEGEKPVKNQVLGSHASLGSTEKIGDKDLTLTFPIGFTANLIKLENQGISLKARMNYTAVWNQMVETGFFYTYPFRYHLNSTSFSVILSKTF